MPKSISQSRHFAGYIISLVALCWCGMAAAQPFSSGSDGSDGALTYPGGAPQTIVFNPATHVPPLDTNFDGIYNFTTITIPANITLQIRATEVGWLPMYWLASGAVQIDGVIDIRGNNGHDQSIMFHLPSIPGPGGFPGGTGGVTSLSITCTSGWGPGAYAGCDARGGNGGNNFLFPLIGGNSGGGAGGDGPGGGAGGGAMLIASTASISMNGSILANGGNAGLYTGSATNHSYGSGAGGSIRLVAPTISGAGTLDVRGGFCCGSEYIYEDTQGRVRLESNQDNFTGTIQCTRTRRVTLVPSATYLVPTTASRSAIHVTMVNGIAVANRPGGSFAMPDVTFNTASPVTFQIQANGIPPGTTAVLILWNQTQYISTVPVPALVGTIDLSTTSVSTVIPNGLTEGFVYATWTP